MGWLVEVFQGQFHTKNISRSNSPLFNSLCEFNMFDRLWTDVMGVQRILDSVPMFENCRVEIDDWNSDNMQ